MTVEYMYIIYIANLSIRRMHTRLTFLDDNDINDDDDWLTDWLSSTSPLMVPRGPDLRWTWRELFLPTVYIRFCRSHMPNSMSTVNFGRTKTNTTSGFLQDLVPKTGFRFITFTGAIGLQEHNKCDHVIMWPIVFRKVYSSVSAFYNIVSMIIIYSCALSLALWLNKILC